MVKIQYPTSSFVSKKYLGFKSIVINTYSIQLSLKSEIGHGQAMLEALTCKLK